MAIFGILVMLLLHDANTVRMRRDMRSKPFFRISVRYSAFLLAMLCILSIGSISLSQGDSAEESPSGNPVMLGLQIARDIIEEELGPPLRMRRWRFYEDDWSSIASWSLYQSFGIDNCVAEVPVLLKRSHILFGWTFIHSGHVE